jgi:integrase
MGSIQKIGNRLYAKLKRVDGSWERVSTGKLDTPDNRRELKQWITKTERAVDAQREVITASGAPAPMTVKRWAATWIDERRKLGLDWKLDRGRLEHHVLPRIGNMLVADVRTRHVIDVVTKIRTTPSPESGKMLSSRTIYNIYSVISALFRDAKLADLIEQTPCCLTERQLGPKRDKDPEWRAGAVFSRDEASTIISSSKIPLDRRVTYAIELLAGLRPGESAALRWRHYDSSTEPLGKLLVASAYSSKRNVTKGTKTETVKHVPVHSTLAAMLGEWKLSGWAAMMGRAPEADDLIIPMPPADAAQRTTRVDDEPFRTAYYSARRWREDDLPALGWRHRRHYDMRASFITLALEDGADPHVIETRVTHTKKSRSAFDGYNRGRQWELTCTEVAKLKIARVRDPHDNVIAMPIAIAVGGTSRDDDHTTEQLGQVVVKPPKSAVVSLVLESGRRDSNPRRQPWQGCTLPLSYSRNGRRHF